MTPLSAHEIRHLLRQEEGQYLKFKGLWDLEGTAPKPQARRKVRDMIDREQWSMLSADVKGDAYEGLLQKSAEDVKGGAGQYFTPRSLIRAVVDVMRPAPGETICDPACGTGGFLFAAHDYIADPQRYQLDIEQKRPAQERHAVRRRAGGLGGASVLHEPAAPRHRRRRC